MHYQRWLKTGDVGGVGRARRMPSNLNDGRSIDDHLVELFLSGIRKLKNKRGCWVCDTAYLMNTGYTEVKIGRGAGGIFRACTHVLSFRHFKGDIPKGVLVCHECDYRACCNPKHLFLGDYNVNQGDMAAKDRVAFGQRHYNAKLTEKNVLSIYRLIDSGESAASIASKFEVSGSCIRQIMHGITWARLYSRRLLSK